MAEYKLSFTASEIDDKLGKVSQLSENVNTLQTNVGGLQTNISGLQNDIQEKAKVVTLSNYEYNNLEQIDDNTLYMLTDGDDEETQIEVPTKVSELENDAGYLTSIPSEYVTESELTAKKYLTSIPSEYVTETELNAKGYLTEHQSLSGYVKSSELGTLAKKSSVAKTDLASAVQTSLNKADTALQSIPSEYITEIELTAKGYLTEHQSLTGYAKTSDLGSLAKKNTVAKTDLTSDVQTSLNKANTALQSYTETDPTVPAWAKASTKPTYTAEEVGAAKEGIVYIGDTEPTDENTEIWINTSEDWNDNIQENVVLYSEQTLTNAQKEQARNNIGAASVEDLTQLNNEKVVYYNAVADGIYVNARYSAENDICYYLCKKGPNSIFDFSKIGLVAMANPVSDVITPTSWLVPSSGDWHAPYVVAAKNNANGDNVSSHYFTGGNHSYTNGATGVATGRTANLKMYADGKLLALGNTGYCGTIKLEWDNFVQGYNTTKADGSGREILREHIMMVFDGEKWTTETTIYPLEDITIETWYGLQFTSTNYAYVAYIGGETGLIYPKGEDSEAGNATTNAMRFFTTNDTAIIEIDTGYDLGTRKCAPNTAKAFFARGSYSKAYGTVMASANLSCGGAYSVRGSYTFKREVQYTPAEPPIVSLLNLNRTQGKTWWSESNYINPTNIYSVAIPSEDPCGIANLTESSITVTDNGNNRGVTFPFLLYETSQGYDRRGKSFILRWNVTNGSNSRLFIMGNFSGMKQIHLNGGTTTSATIAVSADGKTLTVNGTAYTHTAEIEYIGFFFGAKAGTTVDYTNVTLEDVTE